MSTNLAPQSGMCSPSMLPPEIREILPMIKSIEMHVLETEDVSFGPKVTMNTQGITLGLQVSKSTRREGYLKITK